MQSVIFSLALVWRKLDFLELQRHHRCPGSAVTAANWDTLGEKCPKSGSCSMALPLLLSEQPQILLPVEAKGI